MLKELSNLELSEVSSGMKTGSLPYKSAYGHCPICSKVFNEGDEIYCMCPTYIVMNLTGAYKGVCAEKISTVCRDGDCASAFESLRNSEFQVGNYLYFPQTHGMMRVKTKYSN